MAASEFSKFGAPVSTCAELHKMTRFRKFVKGEVILNEGEEISSVYFILNGLVKIVSYSEAGREVWHNELDSGRTFGEMSAISGEGRCASVIALKTTKVAILSQTEFLSLLRTDPDIALWVMKDLVKRLSLSTLQNYELVSKSVPIRVRTEVLNLCPAEPTGKNKYKIQPIPVWAELARRINTDRESVSREISNLVKKKILRREKTCLVVIDRKALIASIDT